MSSTTPQTASQARAGAVEIPPWERLGVNGITAAQMMGCSRSTFFQRVKDGMYPKPAQDGLWNVDALKACRARLAQQ